MSDFCKFGIVLLVYDNSFRKFTNDFKTHANNNFPIDKISNQCENVFMSSAAIT